MNESQTLWVPNIILVDADYVDKVAFDLIVNFERMLGRRIQQADMALWVECIALDSGLRAGEHQTNVILVHEKSHTSLSNFQPAHYEHELSGQAFKGSLGEFVFNSVQTETMAGKEQLMADTLQFLLSQPAVERLMVVADEQHINNLRAVLRKADAPSKHTTLFAMQPLPSGPYSQEILGYSLLRALGISASEITPE
jgi:hypothetical protein